MSEERNAGRPGERAARMADLTCLGLGTGSIEVYWYLLEHPDEAAAASAGRTAAALGLEEADVGRAMAELELLGLLRRSEREQGRSALVDPSIGIERLIDNRFTELNEQLRRVMATRAVIPELAGAFRQGRSRTLPLDIERLDGLEEIRARLDDLAFFAHQEVLALQPSFSPSLIEAARPLDMRCLRRGVALRTVVRRQAVENPVTLAYLRETVALGAQVRFTDRALERLIAYDRTLAVVPVDPEESGRGALVIRQPGLLASMIRLFEEVWESAEDLSTLAGSAEGEEALTAVEREVLRILCEVDKDEIGARRMGVSLRTFRRYVADLMLRLNAANRFHAAMLAKEKGWI
ncbi:helix-turn-helix transcriptional regulator [Kitasatospora sp. NPDC088391]|uniref:helix-turn-helix transcriptional regulator n=1 Tax=Kitasatospora sp. NPDC088391 TaxID=3364074 RepID=UPI0037F4AF42